MGQGFGAAELDIEAVRIVKRVGASCSRGGQLHRGCEAVQQGVPWGSSHSTEDWKGPVTGKARKEEPVGCETWEVRMLKYWTSVAGCVVIRT